MVKAPRLCNDPADADFSRTGDRKRQQQDHCSDKKSYVDGTHFSFPKFVCFVARCPYDDDDARCYLLLEARLGAVEWDGRGSSLPPLALPESFFQIGDQFGIDVERPDAIEGDINPLA